MELQVSLGLGYVYCLQAIQRYNFDNKIQILTCLSFIIVILMASVDKQFYPVQSVIGKTLMEGKVYYLVKWKGFDQTQATWEMAATLKYIKPLIQRYNQQHRAEKNQDGNKKLLKPVNEKSSKAQVGQKLKIVNERGKPLIGKILANQPQNTLKNITKNQQKILLLEKCLSNKEMKNKAYCQEQFSFQQKKKLSSASLCENASEVSEHKNQSLIFKPVCIKRINCSPTNTIPQQMNKMKPNTCNKMEELNECSNKSNSQSLNTTMKDKLCVNSIEQEQTIKKCVSNNTDKTILKRISILHQRKGCAGRQYLIEEQNGKLSIMAGKQLIKLYPDDYLAYFEKILLRFS